MRKILLMSSALVANVLLSSGTEAACIQTPNCTTLGYTSTTACEGGLKCPWGNAWFCNIGSGTGGNSGNIAACHVGAVLNSDKSCTEGQELGKVPIGIIVYADGTGHGQAIALESITPSNGEIRGIESGRVGILSITNFLSGVYYKDECNNLEHGEYGSAKKLTTTNIYVNRLLYTGDLDIEGTGIKEYASLEEASIDFDSKALTDNLLNVKDKVMAKIKTDTEKLSQANSMLKESFKGESASDYGRVEYSNGYDIDIKNEPLVAKESTQTLYFDDEIVIPMIDAAEKVRQYKTTGTKAGDWHLPAPGLFNSIKVYADQIKAGYKALNRSMPTFYTTGFHMAGTGETQDVNIYYLDVPITNTPPNFNSKYTLVEEWGYGSCSFPDESGKCGSCTINKFWYIPKSKLPYITLKESTKHSIIRYYSSGLYGTSSESPSLYNRYVYPVIYF